MGRDWFSHASRKRGFFVPARYAVVGTRARFLADERKANEVCSPMGSAPSPEEYASRGALAGHIFLNPADPDGNSEMAGPFYLAQDLLQFRRGGPLDAQVRYKGSTAYGNYAFDVYNAAAGMPLPETLDRANTYGRLRSHYGDKVVMDDNYKSIPAENVQNITKGYRDYKNGTLCRKP